LGAETRSLRTNGGMATASANIARYSPTHPRSERAQTCCWYTRAVLHLAIGPERALPGGAHSAFWLRRLGARPFLWDSQPSWRWDPRPPGDVRTTPQLTQSKDVVPLHLHTVCPRWNPTEKSPNWPERRKIRYNAVGRAAPRHRDRGESTPGPPPLGGRLPLPPRLVKPSARLPRFARRFRSPLPKPMGGQGVQRPPAIPHLRRRVLICRDEAGVCVHDCRSGCQRRTIVCEIVVVGQPLRLARAAAAVSQRQLGRKRRQHSVARTGGGARGV